MMVPSATAHFKAGGTGGKTREGAAQDGKTSVEGCMVETLGKGLLRVLRELRVGFKLRANLPVEDLGEVADAGFMPIGILEDRHDHAIACESDGIWFFTPVANKADFARCIGVHETVKDMAVRIPPFRVIVFVEQPEEVLAGFLRCRESVNGDVPRVHQVRADRMGFF